MSSTGDDLPEVGEIDRLIHEPVRLLLMAHLYVVESADFLFLMNQLGLTFGNLSSHMSKLEEAGYILIEKTYRGKRPYTLVRLSEKGRMVFKNYMQQMKSVLDNLETY